MTLDTFIVSLDLFFNLSGNKISLLAQFYANLLKWCYSCRFEAMAPLVSILLNLITQALVLAEDHLVMDLDNYLGHQSVSVNNLGICCGHVRTGVLY